MYYRLFGPASLSPSLSFPFFGFLFFLYWSFVFFFWTCHVMNGERKSKSFAHFIRTFESIDCNLISFLYSFILPSSRTTGCQYIDWCIIKPFRYHQITEDFVLGNEPRLLLDRKQTPKYYQLRQSLYTTRILIRKAKERTPTLTSKPAFLLCTRWAHHTAKKKYVKNLFQRKENM